MSDALSMEIQQQQQGEVTPQADIVPTIVAEDGSSVEVGYTAGDPLGPPKADDDGLIAGKFKTQDDLVKAYKELESKLGQTSNKPEDGAAGDGQPGKVDPNAPKVAELETTAEATALLQEKGLNIAAFTAEYETTGQLSDGSYAALEAKGITRDMVNAYIEGQRVMAESQITDIKASVGGDEEYGKLIRWAAANLSDAEKRAYDNILSTRDVTTIKLAAAGLKSRYDAVMGKDPQVLVNGSAPSGGGNDGIGRFESMAQVVEAMKDPRYADDPAYRARVERKIANSNAL